ncbi:hypothetical protein [Quadrisphaera sp. DSM 44207]|uniref:hypothetical protein n=1 Tax=Quadrisphaera sp. DSM 44207 TaxID=1881057 RepID=UPI00088595A0|nr:hypothetical protein [Quadrisphaera sp. DSM 44207]SDQ72467.1 hypothetical protein SAMN05428996_2553 [Quadrisphaera sp. DSM 44207]
MAGTRLSDRTIWAIVKVVIAVAGQVWPLLAFLGLLQVVALMWAIESGDSVPAALAWSFLQVAVVGLVGSFAVHESAHVLVLRRIGTVTHLAVERTTWRTSIECHGMLSPRQVVGVAVAGPSACLAVGVILWISGVGPSLVWWYLAHGVFLLPCFGDGRNLIRGLRQRNPAVVRKAEPLSPDPVRLGSPSSEDVGHDGAVVT